ncbi:hypothetical protein RIR_jg12744.t1 [Rhizophagus irregularis DAOM 181602=DAOM 197198]|nr:hypothetical protein RIR_jg12744.t1 [Rhizophagus irregularis DAOM 181602=DAOM 197198]
MKRSSMTLQLELSSAGDYYFILILKTMTRAMLLSLLRISKINLEKKKSVRKMKKIRGKETDTKDKEFEKKNTSKINLEKKNRWISLDTGSWLFSLGFRRLALRLLGRGISIHASKSDLEPKKKSPYNKLERSWMADMSSRETERRRRYSTLADDLILRRLNWDFVLGGWVWDFDGRSLIVRTETKDNDR